MSDAQREQLSAILDDIYEGFTEGIAQSRGRTVQEVVPSSAWFGKKNPEPCRRWFQSPWLGEFNQNRARICFPFRLLGTKSRFCHCALCSGPLCSVPLSAALEPGGILGYAEPCQPGCACPSASNCRLWSAAFSWKCQVHMREGG